MMKGLPPAAAHRRRFLAEFILEPIEPRTLVRVIALLLAGGAMLWGLGFVGVIDLAFIAANIDSMAAPALWSLGITTASFVFGVAIGMPVGLLRALYPSFRKARSAGPRRTSSFLAAVGLPVYGAGTGFVEAIRGTPFYVQMWITFFLVASLLPKVPFIELWAGILALTINTGAYQSEVFRAGFQSVGQGQVEAAKSVGMSPVKTFASVILPQSLRLIILPLTNEFVSLLKASSILSVIAVQELTFRSRQIGSNLGHPLEAFVMVSLFYLALIIPLSKLLARFEQIRRIPGLGVAEPTRLRGARPPRVDNSMSAQNSLRPPLILRQPQVVGRGTAPRETWGRPLSMACLLPLPFRLARRPSVSAACSDDDGTPRGVRTIRGISPEVE